MLARAPSAVRARPRATKPQRLTVRGRAAQRLHEHRRLAEHRDERDISLEPKPWTFTLAVTLACLEESASSAARKRRPPNPGLDFLTLQAACKTCGVPADEDLIEETLAKVTAYHATKGGPRPLQDRTVGRYLGLTRAEREACQIKTMDACDEPKAQRQARRAEERRAHDRARKEADRRAAGKPSRKVWLASHRKSATKPWTAYNVSRATYYRLLKKGTLPAP